MLAQKLHLLNSRLLWSLFLTLLLVAAIAAPAKADGSKAARPSSTASGVTLLMVEEIGCPYCERWHSEIGGIYPKTAEGRFAPLKTVFIHDRTAHKFERVVYTPTFIVVSKGKEVGRILGYTGEDFFWTMLEEILIKAGYRPDQPAPATQ